MSLFDELADDTRYGLRQLYRNPSFAAVAVITLTLATGANTAIFSVVDTVLFRSLPFRDSSRLVSVTERYRIPRIGVLGPDFAAWLEHNQVFQQIAGFSGTGSTSNLTGIGDPLTVGIRDVTTNLFPTLGVRPIIGRNFLVAEGQQGRNHVAILSEDLWRNHFGTAPQVLGKTISLDGVPYTVVGVMPRTLRYPASDVWEPLTMDQRFSARSRGWALVTVIARLKSGIGIDKAEANLQVITNQLAPEYSPQAQQTVAHARVEVTPLQAQLSQNARPLLFFLLGTVAFILFIACANVANLLLARAVVRSKEMALRSALGASRLRNIQQLLMENLLLAAVGAGAGFFVGFGATKVLNQLIPPNFPSEVRLDWRVLTFSLSITVLAALLFGLLPAWTLSGSNLNGMLQEGGVRTGESRASNQLRNVMSVAQITLSLILLIGGGLMVQSFRRLSNVELGFESHNLVLATIQRPPSAGGNDSKSTAGFFTAVLNRLRSLPGVEGAAATMQYPMMSSAMPWSSTTLLSVPGSGEMPLPQAVPVTITDSDYFRVMKIRVLGGRVFGDRDKQGSPLVTVVNKTLAQILFKGQEPLGQKIKFPAARDWMQIVGVVTDTRNSALEREPAPEMYVPYLQTPTIRMTIVVRARTHPETVAVALRDAVQQVDKDQPILVLSTMDDVIASELAPRQLRMLLVAMFAIVAVSLAAVGIYGVISYSVTRRAREFGVRMALGAPPSYILKLVARQGAKLTLAGLILGVVGALILTRLMSSLLFGVNPRDPLTFTVVTVILATIALVASCVPAYRAAKLDPGAALRQQ